MTSPRGVPEVSDGVSRWGPEEPKRLREQGTGSGTRTPPGLEARVLLVGKEKEVEETGEEPRRYLYGKRRVKNGRPRGYEDTIGGTKTDFCGKNEMCVSSRFGY